MTNPFDLDDKIKEGAMNLNPFDLDDKIKGTTKEVYEGGVDVLKGIWKPFAENAERLLGILGKGVLPIRGLSTMEQEQGIFDSLYTKMGEKAHNIMDLPAISSFVDGWALWMLYPSEEDERRAQALAPDHGISINPTKPDVWEPLGLRSDPSPYSVIGVDMDKYKGQRRTRSDALIDMFETIYGGVYYGSGGDVENPEMRVAFDKGHPRQSASSHASLAPFPEAMYYHRDYAPTMAESAVWDDGLASPVGEEWGAYTGKTDVRQRLLEVIRQQESDEGYEAVNPKSGATGAYQFMPVIFDAYVKQFIEQKAPGSSPEDYKITDPATQDLIAEFAIGDLLRKYKGDIGAVAADWYQGAVKGVPAYNKGEDLIFEDDPNLMEYVAEIVIAYHNLMMTGTFMTPEEVRAANAGPLGRDTDGNLSLFHDSRTVREGTYD